MKNLSFIFLSFLLLASCKSGGGVAAVFSVSEVVQGVGAVSNQIGDAGSVLGGSSGLKRDIGIMAEASSQCTVHADPATDGDTDHDGIPDSEANGILEESERLSESAPSYALKKFYCTMTLESTGPETVKGAMSLMEQIVCSVEKMHGAALPYDDQERSITAITMDLSCASQADLDDMGCTPGASSISLPFTGTWVSTTDPHSFPELSNLKTQRIPAVTYNHGIRLDGTMESLECDKKSKKFRDAGPFTVVLAANFDEETVEQDFEFITSVDGLRGEGRSEVTAGKMHKDGDNTDIWFEYRDNRVGSGPGDDNTFSRHIRLKGTAVYSGDEVTDLQNFSGLITDVYAEVPAASNVKILSAYGSNMATGITGQLRSASSVDLGLGDILYEDIDGADQLSCAAYDSRSISISAGACGLGSSGRLPIDSLDSVRAFILPGGDAGDNSDWVRAIALQSGIGFSSVATITLDTQTADCGLRVCR